MTKKQIDLLKRDKVEAAFEAYIGRMFPDKKIRKATYKEDTERFIDYWINGVPTQLKIKRCESRDERNNIWVEFLSISGKAGWVLGDARILMEIHFSMNDGELADVYVCDMKELAKLSIANTMGKRLVDVRPSETYVPYRRGVWGNRDMIARVPIEDLSKLKSYKTWKADKIFSDERRNIEAEFKKIKDETK